MKRILLFCIFIFSLNIIYPQSNSTFINMRDKELATFNDAITLMRLVFDEKDSNDNFIMNALWAAEKKLFKVTIPIEPESVNPVISRKEFAYWLCRISEIGGKMVPVTRLDAYKRVVDAGIMFGGRGPEDSFSGIELLETFSYFDYYVRSNKIKLRLQKLPLYEDNYDGIPEWRAKLYRELDEQRAYEKKLREEKRNKKKSTRINNTSKEEINTKIVE